MSRTADWMLSKLLTAENEKRELQRRLTEEEYLHQAEIEARQVSGERYRDEIEELLARISQLSPQKQFKVYADYGVVSAELGILSVSSSNGETIIRVDARIAKGAEMGPLARSQG